MQNTLKYTDSRAPKLLIYQNDYDSTKGGTTFNGNNATGILKDPSKFVMASAYSGNITFNGNASWGGVLYAPNANIKLNGTFDYFGSLIVKSMDRGEVNGSFAFHFD